MLYRLWQGIQARHVQLLNAAKLRKVRNTCKLSADFNTYSDHGVDGISPDGSFLSSSMAFLPHFFIMQYA